MKKRAFWIVAFVLGMLGLVLLVKSKSQHPRGLEQADPLPAGSVGRFGTTLWRSDARIQCIAFSPNGNLIASAGADDVSLWNVRTGRRIQRCPSRQVHVLAFSPDGAFLAAGCDHFSDMTERGFSGNLVLWTVSDAAEPLKEVYKSGNQGSIGAMAFSADGNAIGLGHDDGLVTIWDHRSQELITTFLIAGPVRSLSFSVNGDILYAGGDDGTVSQWATKSWTLQHSWKPAGDANQGLDLRMAISKQGQCAVSTSHSLQVFDLTSQKTLGAVPRPTSQATFSNDGTLLVFADPTQQQVCTLQLSGRARDVANIPCALHDFADTAFAFSPDNSQLAWLNGQAIHLWEFASKSDRNSILSSDVSIASIAISPDGNTVAGASWHELWIWEKRGLDLHVTSRKKLDVGGQVTFSPDGKTLAISARTTIRLLDLPTDTEQILHAGEKSLLERIAFSPDGKYLIAHDVLAHDVRNDPQYGSICLWELKTQKLTRRSSAPVGSNFAFSPAAPIVAFAANDQTYLWDYEADRMQPALATGAASALAFSHDGKIITVAGVAAFQRWDLLSHRCLVKTEYPQLFEAEIAPNDRLVACLRKNASTIVDVWDSTSAVDVARFDGHAGSVRSVVFFPDGKFLLTSSDDTTVLIWDLREATNSPKE